MELKLAPQADTDALDDAFFQQSSIAPVEMELSDEDLEEWHEDLPRAKSARRTMHIALGMLGVSLTAVGGFLLYAKVIMPTPVELGASSATLATLQPMAAFEEGMKAAPIGARTEPVAPALAAVAPATVAAAPAVQHDAPVFEAGDPGPVRAAAAQQARAASPTTRKAPSEDTLVKQAFRSLNRGDAREAVVQARLALNAAPSRADAWLVLGSAYAALHDQPSAQLAFRNCAQRSGPQARTCEQLVRN